MSTLHGTLAAALSRDYEKQTSALHQNAEAINRFGDLVIKPFDLVPHVKPLQGGGVGFVAHCVRGRDHAPLLLSLADAGFTVGKAEKHQMQFNDGYTIWTAPVKSREIAFCLVFYTPVDAS